MAIQQLDGLLGFNVRGGRDYRPGDQPTVECNGANFSYSLIAKRRPFINRHLSLTEELVEHAAGKIAEAARSINGSRGGETQATATRALRRAGEG